MLKSLYIKNFTLIDELDIELYPGFSVITGETGAGKSIILGAIALLLGQRADSKSIKQGADKCIIEAHFDLTRYDLDAFFSDNDIENDAEDCIVRRELLASGKSRAFINDTPVQLSMLKELGERLVDVHSQHQNLLLNKQDFQLGVVDIFADDATQLSQYQKTYKEYHLVKQQLDELRENIERNRQNADFLRFQCRELTEAHLVEGEQEELEQQSDTMSHSEDIKSALYEADNALTAEQTGVVTALRSTLYELRKIGEVYPAAAELEQRIDSCYIGCFSCCDFWVIVPIEDKEGVSLMDHPVTDEYGNTTWRLSRSLFPSARMWSDNWITSRTATKPSPPWSSNSRSCKLRLRKRPTPSPSFAPRPPSRSRPRCRPNSCH